MVKADCFFDHNSLCALSHTTHFCTVLRIPPLVLYCLVSDTCRNASDGTNTIVGSP